MSYNKAQWSRFAARYLLPAAFAVGILVIVRWDWGDAGQTAESVPLTKLPAVAPTPVFKPNLPAESANGPGNQVLPLPLSPPSQRLELPSTAALTQPTDVSTAVTLLPQEAMDLIKAAVAETIAKNYTSAALALLDAIELSSDYPEKHEYMHQLAGWNYEQAGLVDYAIEQYQYAVAINPTQRASYEGLMRLDPEFRATHDPLPDPSPTKSSATQDKPEPESSL